MTKFENEQFTSSHWTMLRPGIELFNSQHFWECHEALEDAWMDLQQEPVRYIFWSVIQVATGLYHWKNNNVVGAQGQFKKAREKLDKCHELNIESDFLFAVINWSDFKKKFQADSGQLILDKSLLDFKFIIKKGSN
jgi:hypothetical protein